MATRKEIEELNYLYSQEEELQETLELKHSRLIEATDAYERAKGDLDKLTRKRCALEAKCGVVEEVTEEKPSADTVG